jgi:hypothetical protein
MNINFADKAVFIHNRGLLYQVKANDIPCTYKRDHVFFSFLFNRTNTIKPYTIEYISLGGFVKPGGVGFKGGGEGF